MNNTLFVIGILCAVAFIVMTVYLMRRGKQQTPRVRPTPLPRPKPTDCKNCGTHADDAPHCHYCMGRNLGSGKLVLLRCPNCKTNHWFHEEFCSGAQYNRLQPCCEGVYVGSNTTHTYALTQKDTCTNCKLEKEYWDKWYCTPGVQKLNQEQMKRIALKEAQALGGIQ